MAVRVVVRRRELRDRPRLMVHHPPDAADAREVIGGGERCPIHQLDAQNVAVVAVDDRVRIGADDLGPSRIVDDVAPGSDHRAAANDRRPSRMDAGDAVAIGPERRKCGKITGREGCIEGRVGRQEVALVTHHDEVGQAAGKIKRCLETHIVGRQKLASFLQDPLATSLQRISRGPAMLETAIVGGGLCGIALARSLRQRGGSFALFEARHRLGGRVLSARSRTGLALDLGPTWFWPDTQPLLTGLIAELGLSDFAQHDDGTVLHLKEADKSPEPISGPPLHQGARRLSGGMTRLIEALVRDLPPSSIHTGHELMRVIDCGTHVRLVFATSTESVAIEAKRAVLALPPRLLIDHVGFRPELDDATFEAMRSTETWMAAQAKVVIAYDQARWRDKGLSGNAFASHEQAVVGEIFDACDEGGDRAALGGFLAFAPALRETFAVGLPMLMDSQMVQLFGAELDGGEQHYQDWATERFTCSALDRTTPRGEHSEIASPMLRRPLWDLSLIHI